MLEIKTDIEIELAEAATLISDAMSIAIRSIEAEARKLAPRRTGALANAISAGMDNPLSAYLLSAAPYSSYLHSGTGIYGPAGRPLRFLLVLFHLHRFRWQRLHHPPPLLPCRLPPPLLNLLRPIRSSLAVSAVGSFV